MNAQREIPELIERAAPAPIRLDEMFTGQAARTPDAVAILCKGQRTSYAALDKQADQFANRLLEQGLTHGDRVAIALPRSVDLIAAMIGSMKIGCVYIPIDRSLPAERIAFILRDSGAKAVLAPDPDIVPRDFKGVVIDGAGVDTAIAPPTIRTRASDPAYILYTSGSTGQPKGVLLGHNACHYIAASIRHFRSGELQRVAAVTSISFDPSVFEIFAPLACGGTIILKDDALQPFTADEHPTLMQGVPTALRQLARANAIPDSVQIINSGGETLTRAIADEIFARSAVRHIYNHYGPTEASICTTISAVHRDSDIAPDVGMPVAGAELYIRDMETGEPVANGEPGEIRIGGPVLALGYVNDPRLTEACFVIDAHAMTRVYRTGDFGRINAQGRLEFLGRADDQVKLRGHRIELAEIDDAMIAADRVTDAGAVVVRLDDSKSHLIGFACLDDPARKEGSARENLFFAMRQRLPASMLPHRIEWLDTIPRLPSGKVDRARLCQIAKMLPDPVAANDATGNADLARTIGAMFGEALSREPLGEDEDFFAMGGDSLMCVDIAIRLEEMLERPVAVNLLAHHSTPRELVAVLSLQKNIHSLVTREGNADGDPIFLTPGIGGSDTDYDSLCPNMGHRRLVKLHALPISDRLIAEPCIDTLISTLVPLIEKEQPEGRITLLGYSVGGVVAYALARDLEQRGRDTRLIIIDSQISHCDADLSDWKCWLADHLWPSIRDDGLKFSLPKLARSLRFWFPRSIGRFQRGHIPDFLATEHREYGASLIKAEAALRYTQRSSPTLLILADRIHKSDHFRNPVGFAGWRRLLVGDRIAIRHMPATHSQLIRRPFVHRLGTLIEGWLTEETGR